MIRVRKTYAEILAEREGGNGREGLRCPQCHCPMFGQPGRAILKTRQVEAYVERVRVCRACGHTWKTIEK